MGIFDFLIKKCDPGEPLIIHVGHFAAFGAKVAAGLSQQGIRHTAMTSEHLRWSEKPGGFRLIGWGNGKEIEWPERAVEHVNDLRTFKDNFGPESTACLRLGYVYQLGPIGEWLFFQLSDLSKGMSPPLGRFQIQWKAPPNELHLGEDGLLKNNDTMQATYINTIDEHYEANAKRLQMASLIQGIVTHDRGLESSSLKELANLYSIENRTLRALVLEVAANCRSEPGEVGDNRFFREFQNNFDPDADEEFRSNIEQVVRSSHRSTALELLWYLEDLEISQSFCM